MDDNSKIFSEVKVEAKIIKADGTIINLGEIDYWHKNPLKRWAFKIKKYFKKPIEEYNKLVELWSRSYLMDDEWEKLDKPETK